MSARSKNSSSRVG
jgi:hypothetical protein